MTPIDQESTDSPQPVSGKNGDVYEITIRGILDDHWKQWFEGMTMTAEEGLENEQGHTIITGPIADQPALHGLLAKIRDLNLTLLSVRKLAKRDADASEARQDAEPKDPHGA